MNTINNQLLSHFKTVHPMAYAHSGMEGREIVASREDELQ